MKKTMRMPFCFVGFGGITLFFLISGLPSKPPGRAAGFHESSGIVFGQGVRVRRDSMLDSPVIAQISTGALVQVLRVSTNNFLPPGQLDTFCQSYPMVEVKTEDNRTGWIFGKYVFRILDQYENIPESSGAVQWKGVDYRLKACRNFGVGVSDEDGLTGCDEFYPVVLIDQQSARAYPVSLHDAEKGSVDFRFWNLGADESGVELIEKISVRDGRLIARVKAYMMEGCRHYSVEVRQNGAQFTAQVANAQRYYDKHCD